MWSIIILINLHVIIIIHTFLLYNKILVAGLNLSNGGYFPNPDEDSSLPSSDTRSQTTPLLPSPLFSLLKQQSSLSDEKSNGIQRTNKYVNSYKLYSFTLYN